MARASVAVAGADAERPAASLAATGVEGGAAGAGGSGFAEGADGAVAVEDGGGVFRAASAFGAGDGAAAP